MPFSIRLEQDMVNQLRGIAVRSHRSVSDVVKEALEVYITGQSQQADVLKSPLDRIAHLIGCIDRGGVTRSVDTGRLYAAMLKERHRARRAR
jgi:hypothetical protein